MAIINPIGLGEALGILPDHSQTATFNELKAAWLRNGGPANVADKAAAIAMAESHGNTHAKNKSGATGAWQILGQVVSGDLTNLDTNAKNAVAKYNNSLHRTGDGFRPWVTYTQGTYKQYLPSGGGSGDFPTGITDAIGNAASPVTDTITAVPKFLGTLGEAIFSGAWWLRVGKILLGVVALAFGISALSKELGGPSMKDAAAVAAL